MRGITRISISFLLASVPLISSGCSVSQTHYDDLVLANRTLEEQVVRLESERDASDANLQSALNELSRTRGELGDMQTGHGQLQGDLGQLNRDYDDLLQRVSRLQIGPLPQRVQDDLSRLSASYPDILTFDARLGMLRFASDLTFDSGKDTLKSEAADTIRAVAGILSSSDASGLEVRIVGHTDNVPIRYSKAQHPTNTHLSVHRAIAVQSALVSAGVDPVRVQVAGYGEFRPMVANQAGGTRENRRVEMFLVPMPEITIPVSAVATPVENTASEPADDYDEPMK